MSSTSEIAAFDADEFSPQRLICSQFVVTDLKDGVLRARLLGPHIGEREAQIIARELNTAIAEAGRRIKAVVMDMKAVRAMSSLGLGMCIDVRNTAHANGARTIMMGLNRELYELFRMMKVDRLYTIAHDREELKKLLK